MQERRSQEIVLCFSFFSYTFFILDVRIASPLFTLRLELRTLHIFKLKHVFSRNITRSHISTQLFILKYDHHSSFSVSFFSYTFFILDVRIASPLFTLRLELRTLHIFKLKHVFSRNITRSHISTQLFTLKYDHHSSTRVSVTSNTIRFRECRSYYLPSLSLTRPLTRILKKIRAHSRIYTGKNEILNIPI